MAIDFKTTEKEAREVWEKHKKEIELAVQNDKNKPLFSFLEGPPTANAPPGLHHLEVRTFKDIICKFKYMQGFSVPRKGGWDCHGLPVEVQVEKSLGLNSKKDILKYGEEKFITDCQRSIFSNIGEWNKSTEELAYWIDLKNPYRTLDNNYVESVWWSLKELYKKKLLYEGYKVVPFCPRCETPLSSHEVAQGYKDIKEESVFIAFPVKGKNEEYVLAWTTTPWTLPGNIALAVNPSFDYVQVKLEDESKLILGKEKVELIKGKYEVIKNFKGKDLVGLEYDPLYKIKELESKNSYKIISGDFVTVDDGTGIVHTAGMYGEEDYNVGKKFNLPEVHTVGQDGRFLDIVPEFLRGKNIKESEWEIKSDLKKRNLLFKIEKINHSYPFCWRCDSPLMYYAIQSWFIAASKMKEKMIKLNKKINWNPKHIQEGRFGMWLENLKDWNLSRFKFWGTPLPVWRCVCGKEKIIGSVEELKNESTKKFTEYDLHRPWIDEIKLKCVCGKEMTRIKDLIDCWYDSGSATFAQFHYPFENKEEFEKRFPYDFISEAIDQTRGWFYTLHAISSMLFGKIAYKNVICAGHILDEKGEKMSKSKGNILSPREMFDSVGVDAVRLQMCTNDPGNSKRFSIEMIKESVLPFLNVLYNCKTYYNQLEDKKIKEKIEDKWIQSKLNNLILDSTQDLEEFNIEKAVQKIMNFVVNDFSRTYIRFTRERNDTKEIIGNVLKEVGLLLAPYAPYVSEWIFQEFEKGESVHLSKWSVPNKKKINKKLEEEFNLIQEIIERGLKERDISQIGLKWPLSKVEVSSKVKISKKLQEIIKTQLNVRKYIEKIHNDDELKVEMDFKMNSELIAEGYAREVSRKVQALRKKMGLNKENLIELTLEINKDFRDILMNQEKLIRERTNSKIVKFEEKFSSSRGEIENFKIKEHSGKVQIVRLRGSN
ncbi:isoleucine--tRNA ligase [archaeon]|nr:isoleucine--tRNA ligase [archaeon]